MRTVLIAISAMIALAVWLTTTVRIADQDVGRPLPTGSSEATLRGDDRSSGESTIAAPIGAPSVGETSAKTATAAVGPASTTPFRRSANPRLRGVFAGYLMGRGLSEEDSRRIADAAMAGLSVCLDAVFGPGDTFRKGAAFLACKGDVLQEHGLSEAAIVGSIYGP